MRAGPIEPPSGRLENFMTRKKQNDSPFEQEILGFLKNRKGGQFSRKEISHALQIKKNSYHLFRKSLSNLIRQGRIVRLKGGRLTIPTALRDVRGQLQMTRKGFAFVTDERTAEDIFISAQHLNTALDKDLVEVQLFGVSRGRNKEGKVTKIISRSRTRFVGTYHRGKYYGFVVADDPKVPRDFYVPNEKAMAAKDGQKVVVEMESWESSQLNPQGSIVQILGYPDEPGVDVSSVALGFGLPLEFDSKLEKEAAAIRLKVSPAELDKRLDLRDQLVFTVDPPDAKDFDDAISLQQTPQGTWRLGVHIADVSHFVTENSPLNEEAFLRSTSVYLVDRVIPMLPEHLSNEICSLQPNEERLTYSCIMDIDDNGNVVDYTIRKSIINSKRRFTYQEVQEILDNPDSTDPYKKVLDQMHRLSRILREKRLANGAIDFETPEVRFRLDEKGHPVEIIPVQRRHSNEMIEEFMLMANQTVTRHVQKLGKGGRPLPFIYRVHEKPDAEKLQKFNTFLKALGHKVQIKSNISPGEFQSVLKAISGGSDDALIKEVALRTMMKAVYSPKNVGHFGLAFQHYTHFTSPIRRYPDLVVHRLLNEYEQAVAPERQRDIAEKLKRICQVASERERKAMEAERESVRVKQIEWISEHKDELFDGIISGVTSFGIFVQTVPYLIEGLVAMENLDDDFYIFEEKSYSLIGKESGRRLRLGGNVKVRVSGIDRERNQVNFRLIES